MEQEEEDMASQREVNVQTVVPAWGTREEASEVPFERQKQILSLGALSLPPTLLSSSGES